MGHAQVSLPPQVFFIPVMSSGCLASDLSASLPCLRVSKSVFLSSFPFSDHSEILLFPPCHQAPTFSLDTGVSKHIISLKSPL